MKVHENRYLVFLFAILIISLIFNEYWNMSLEPLGNSKILVMIGLFILIVVLVLRFSSSKKNVAKVIASSLLMTLPMISSISLWGSDRFPLDFIVGIALMYVGGIFFMLQFVELTRIETQIERKRDIFLVIFPLILLLIVYILSRYKRTCTMVRKLLPMHLKAIR